MYHVLRECTDGNVSIGLEQESVATSSPIIIPGLDLFFIILLPSASHITYTTLIPSFDAHLMSDHNHHQYHRVV